MHESTQVCVVVFVVAAYYLFVLAVLRVCKRSIFEAAEPVRLCYAALIWTLCVFSVFTAAALRTPNDTPAGGTDTWFTAGWGTGLSVLGVRINTWYKYLLIVLYQITRCVLGSLIANVFRPFLVAEVQSKALNKSLDRRKKPKILGAQFSTTVFAFLAMITDMFLYLKQMDMSLISLFTALSVDAICTNYVLDATAHDVKMGLNFSLLHI
jgi:hypothetical protein